MTEPKWKPLPSVDRDCFACGTENSHGLQMTFESNGEQLRSTLIVKPRFRGWSNLVHGGILSTMLDETMSWTAIHLTERFILTKGMTVSFKKPVRVGTTLSMTGIIKERISERKARVVAEIRDEDGEICAASEGEFILFTLEEFGSMGIMSEEELTVMASAMG
ncbi:PaaI family thioesterase [Desulfoluna sp.]|uniref:PaaI family thioesterase n=1 Tax=Desulfoluna sp. TaxID=2045199 RepID=UPI0026127D87|nr:PaaI family thioesterase [Desulfoluna sp.]